MRALNLSTLRVIDSYFCGVLVYTLTVRSVHNRTGSKGHVVHNW